MTVTATRAGSLLGAIHPPLDEKAAVPDMQAVELPKKLKRGVEPLGEISGVYTATDPEDESREVLIVQMKEFALYSDNFTDKLTALKKLGLDMIVQDTDGEIVTDKGAVLLWFEGDAYK